MRKMVPFLISCFLSLVPPTLSAEEYRDFRNNDGVTIHARITDYDPDSGVSLELRDGRRYNSVALELFSAEDRDFVRSWFEARIAAKNDAPLKPDSRLIITVKLGRNDKLNDGSDPDNREVDYSPGIVLENEDKDLSYKNIRGTLVIIGESVLESREYHVLYKEDFTLDVSTLSSAEWAGSSFKNVYDDYADNGSAFGADYEGYLVALRNKEGQVQMIKTSKTKWQAAHERILSANTRRAYSHDFSSSFEKTVY